jgi:hypothetical protein
MLPINFDFTPFAFWAVPLSALKTRIVLEHMTAFDAPHDGERFAIFAKVPDVFEPSVHQLFQVALKLFQCFVM